MNRYGQNERKSPLAGCPLLPRTVPRIVLFGLKGPAVTSSVPETVSWSDGRRSMLSLVSMDVGSIVRMSKGGAAAGAKLPSEGTGIETFFMKQIPSLVARVYPGAFSSLRAACATAGLPFGAGWALEGEGTASAAAEGSLLRVRFAMTAPYRTEQREARRSTRGEPTVSDCIRRSGGTGSTSPEPPCRRGAASASAQQPSCGCAPRRSARGQAARR